MMGQVRRRASTALQGLALTAALVTGQTFNLFNLPALSTHRDARADVAIQASPDAVWNLLTDLPGYPRWNPYIYPATGRVAAGETLDLELHAGGQTAEVEVTVFSVTPNHVLSWGGTLLGVSRKLTFTIDDLGSGRVDLTADEQFSGLLLPFVGGIPDQAQQGLDEMVRALRSAAEVDAPPPAPAAKP